MLDMGGGIADLNVGEGVRAALVADEHGIALGEVAGTGRVFEHLHLAAIGVLTALGRNALGDDGAAGVFADVVHLGAGVGLLPLGRDGHRVKFADRMIALQDAARVLPSDGRAGLDLGPRNFGAVAATRAALGDEVVNPAFAVFVARIPVLHGGVLDLGIAEGHELDDGRVELVFVAHGCGAAL